MTRRYQFQSLSNIKSLTRGTPLGEREKLWTKPVGGFNFLLILFWQSQSKCSHGPLEGYKPWKNKITKMGKVIIFVTELNLLLPCFGLSALYYSRHLTLPAGPESLHRHTQIMPLYGHSWFNSQWGRPPLFLSTIYLLVEHFLFLVLGRRSWISAL